MCLSDFSVFILNVFIQSSQQNHSAFKIWYVFSSSVIKRDNIFD